MELLRIPLQKLGCQLFPMIFPRLSFMAKLADGIILLVLFPMLAPEPNGMRDAMFRGVLVCSALLAVALLVSGCGAGSISEAEQQSLAAAATCTRNASAGRQNQS